MSILLKINLSDNVAVALRSLHAGENADGIDVINDIPCGHKIALCDIKRGESVIKYGYSIGIATSDIAVGQHVHTHNLKTAIAESESYEYVRAENKVVPAESPVFYGYRRKNGSVGIRNEIWILPLVGCVNKTAEKIAAAAAEKYGSMCDGIFAFTHPYGCSQLGDDMLMTQKILAGLCRHPNTAGVLLLSLGCENNNLQSFLPVLGDLDKDKIKTLVAQEVEDEIGDALGIIGSLAERASLMKRTEISARELIVGFKCGGSDGFSGITANPLCGRLTDKMTAYGGSVILTETPEMFGAETVLMSRAENSGVFEKTVAMINGFKKHFTDYGQTVYENPSPGNKAGGITTLEEKSLGCIQKGGTATVTDVLGYGEPCVKSGLNLLTGPGNDIVSCTNLVASGAHMIIFTTGRGTPLGAPVPTLKISTNTDLFYKKSRWTDYNAGEIINGKSLDVCADELMSLVLETASGKSTKSELNGCREIAIFKNGVTL